MSHQNESARIDLDTVFKIFGVVAILIGVVLTVVVIALSDPFGTAVSLSPVVFGTFLFTGLLVAVMYLAYTMRRG